MKERKLNLFIEDEHGNRGTLDSIAFVKQARKFARKDILEKIQIKIKNKIEFIEKCCKGKERQYRYYELANLRDEISDLIKNLK